MGMKCRIKSRLCAVLAAIGFLAAVCLLAALPRTAALARGLINTERECALTVKTEILVQDGEGENADWSELNKTQIQVYLYRVAEVNQYGEYEGLEGFEGLELEKIDSTVKADDWREKARAAADTLGLPVPIRAEETGSETPDWNADGPAGGTASAAAPSVGAGRLALPEAMELPADLPDKLARADAEITVENGIGTMQGLPQGMYLVWVMPVETDNYQYTFRQNQRYGSLLLRKTLHNYKEALGAAMFVFRVEARKDLNHDGEKEIVYSNVVGLEFDAAGEKEAVVEHIPAGSEVTVEEIYSGSAYTIQGSAVKDVTVWAKDSNDAGNLPAVEFANDYDDRVTYGTGAVNHFTHDGNGWSGNRVQGSEGGGGR